MILRRSTPLRYALAILAVVLATAIRWPFNPFLEDWFPFILPFAVVIAAAWFGGRGPGLTSVLLGAVATLFFILPPTMSFAGKQPRSLYQVVAFAFVGSIAALLTGSLRIANDAIQDREGQLESMAAAMPEILFTADSSGRVEMLSERFYEYAGKKLSDLSSFGWMDLVHSEERDLALDAWSISVRDKTEFRSTCRLRRRDGTYCWFQCRAVPMQDKQQRVLRWFGVCADIDDRKHLEDALASQTRALTQSNQDLQRFAFAASHDLQEPLRMIGIFSDLLIRSRPPSAESDYFVAQIQGGVKRMQDLIEAALEYSRITSREAETPTVIGLEEPLSNAMWNLQAAIQESGAEMKFAQLPQVIADPQMISRVFQNLISNAIKFRSQERPVIRISAEKNGDMCVVAVSDNGIGMSMDYAQYVFEAFRQLHPKSEYPGSGLGLAGVKRIIELHRGRVWVESTPGTGSTFFFTLPSAEGRT